MAARSVEFSLSMSTSDAHILGWGGMMLVPRGVTMVGDTTSPPNTQVSRVYGRQDREKVILTALALEI